MPDKFYNLIKDFLVTHQTGIEYHMVMQRVSVPVIFDKGVKSLCSIFNIGIVICKGEF